MKRTAEKVALAAFVCISLIFVVICLLTYLNVIPLNGGPVFEIDWALMVILLVLGAMWVLLAAYLLFTNFSQRSTLKYVMLYSDCHSSTRATSRVIKRLAIRESKQLAGVKISRVNISSNEHLGLNMKIILEISNDDVAFSVDTLRYLLTDKYREVLGLEFAAMDFQLKKVRSGYRADLGKAQAQAKRLNDKRQKCTSANCHIEHSEDAQGEVSGNLAVAAVDDQGEKVFVTEENPTQAEGENDRDFSAAEEGGEKATQSGNSAKNTQNDAENARNSHFDDDFEQYNKKNDNEDEISTPDQQQENDDQNTVAVADEETKRRVAERERKQRETAETEKNHIKPIYGTPESPIAEDIVVQIDDEADTDLQQQAENEDKAKTPKQKGKTAAKSKKKK